LKHLHKQDIDKSKIEIIISDGGSSDDTVKISKRNRAKVLNNKKILAEPGVSLGMKHASGDLMMIMAVDNYFLQKNAISQIIEIFKKNKEITAAFPIHCSENHFSIFSKYHNAFTDPFSHFVYGNSSNGRTFHKVYSVTKKNQNMVVYDYFSSKAIPLIAFAQGFIIRNGYKREEKHDHDDCMPIIELIQNNKKIGYLPKLCLYHDTIRGLKHFVRKQRWATLNYLKREKFGVSERLSNFSKWQNFKKSIWPFYSTTLIFPIIVALINFMFSFNYLWLWHPPMAFISGWSSAIQFVIFKTSKRNTSINRLLE